MNISNLHQLFLECSEISTDTRKIVSNCLFFALKGDNFNGNKFAQEALDKGAKYAVVDEEEYATNDSFILVDDVLGSLQELAKFHRNYLKIPIIALTGSNGKTTTKELINTVLSKKFKTIATLGNLNNHIGVPLTLLSMNKETEFGIVEMGANHLKEIEFLCAIAQPDYGYITNFGKAHLEGFGSEEGVIRGKTELYKHLMLNGKLIFLNGNDNKQIEQVGSYSNYFKFGDELADVEIKFRYANPFVSIIYAGKEIDSQLIGTYNFNNIAAAIAIGQYFKIDTTTIKEAIESYVPENNRSQIIQKGTTKIILDAYNANPTSMKAALDSFSRLDDSNRIAILGDMFELGVTAIKEHKFIADYAKSLNLLKVYLIGSHFNQVKTESDDLIVFESFEDFKTHFNQDLFENSTLLIKGSRGMALERVLDLLN